MVFPTPKVATIFSASTCAAEKSLFLRSTTDLPNEPTTHRFIPPCLRAYALAHAAWSINSVPSADLPNEPTARRASSCSILPPPRPRRLRGSIPPLELQNKATACVSPSASICVHLRFHQLEWPNPMPKPKTQFLCNNC